MSRLVVLALLAEVAVPGPALARAAVVAGTVTDATGLVLPGVTVKARNAEDGGPTAITVTDAGGAFTFSGLPPGTYDLTFTLPGFRPGARRGVQLGAGAAVVRRRHSSSPSAHRGQ